MKLLIAGGAGDMGSYIVRDSVRSTIWTKIVIGDLDEYRATKLILNLDDSRLSYTRINANNHAEMVQIIQNFDVVCSAIGPFYIFGPKVARACIEARDSRNQRG